MIPALLVPQEPVEVNHEPRNLPQVVTCQVTAEDRVQDAK